MRLCHGTCHFSRGLLEGTETTSMGVERSDGCRAPVSSSPPMLYYRISFSIDTELHIQVALSTEACVWFSFGQSIFLSYLT